MKNFKLVVVVQNYESEILDAINDNNFGISAGYETEAKNKRTKGSAPGSQQEFPKKEIVLPPYN